MAEGFGKALSDGRFEIRSAGTSPIGVHPMAIAIMKEAGIDISEQSSDFLSPELSQWPDYLITLCGSACERIPPLPSRIKHIHWDIENPDQTYLSERTRHDGFARIRDQIRKNVEELLLKIDKGEV
jgi:arsenate reductase